MKTKVVPSSWLIKEEHRLDCSPFTSGGIEARKQVEDLNCKKQPLIDLTLGGIEGIYHVGQDKIRWVETGEFGVPFLRSSDILKTDLSVASLISRTQVEANPLFRCPAGTTLITRSGTIGRVVYAREEMSKMAISQDVLKVVPDTDTVPSGYLYAYLSSRFGIPQIVSGTFGSIIVHIEAENIMDLPIPRLGRRIESDAHNRVEAASAARSKAHKLKVDILRAVESELKWQERSLSSLSSTVSATSLQRRMDAFHHSLPIREARAIFANHESAVRLGDHVAEVFEPNRGSRNKVEDSRYGVPFLSSSQVFALDPVGEYLVSNKTPNLDRLLIEERDLLLPRSGQLGGIIGRAVLPLPQNCNDAASEHLVRIRCHRKEDAFYLWALFASQPGYFSAIGTAYGSSIPSLDCELLENLQVPWLVGKIRSAMVNTAESIFAFLAEAVKLEREAVAVVERCIVGGGAA